MPGVPGPPLDIARTGCRPQGDPPFWCPSARQVLFWGLREDGQRQELASLADELTRALCEAGLLNPDPRPFAPHLTIAKLAPAATRRRTKRETP